MLKAHPCGHRDRGGEGETHGESNTETSIPVLKKRQPRGICCLAQETQRGGVGGEMGGSCKRVGQLSDCD